MSTRVAPNFLARYCELLSADRHITTKAAAERLGCTWRTASQWRPRALEQIAKLEQAAKLGVASAMIAKAEDPQHRASLAALDEDLDQRLVIGTKAVLATSVATTHQLAQQAQLLAKHIAAQPLEKLGVADAYKFLVQTSAIARNVVSSVDEVVRLSELLQGRPDHITEVQQVVTIESSKAEVERLQRAIELTEAEREVAADAPALQ